VLQAAGDDDWRAAGEPARTAGSGLGPGDDRGRLAG